MKNYKIRAFFYSAFLMGEYGNIEYHSGLINRPNDEGGSQAIMEAEIDKKEEKKALPYLARINTLLIRQAGIQNS